MKEKKRKLKLDILSLLTRYRVFSSKQLEAKIKIGEIEKHPAWEDLMTLENLETALEKVDGYPKNLQKTS